MEAELAPSAGLDALRHRVALTPIADRGWIAVTGEDRVRWLNGMVTNSVQALRPGEGAYAFLLNAQGRIQGDATVWCASEDLLLLETDRAELPRIVELLDRFIIMDDVELADVSAEWQGVDVIGPAAVELLASVGFEVQAGPLAKRSVEWQGHAFSVVTAHSPLVPHFEVWSRDVEALTALTSALETSGVARASAASLELLRILEGVPRYGVDIRDRELPQETAQTRALHFNKGCYLGQEIVERIRSRGQVHRTFASFVLSGETPTPGTELVADGKPVGMLTSIAAEPVDGLSLALGYVRREAVERRLPLHYTAAAGSGTAAMRAEAPEPQLASNA